MAKKYVAIYPNWSVLDVVNFLFYEKNDPFFLSFVEAYEALFE